MTLGHFWAWLRITEKFIRGFSQLAKPLTDLTREKTGWQWDKREGQSFLALKAAMATAPVLRLPRLRTSVRCNDRCK